ncbi:MAG: hypothetical protein EON88_32320 [Brevundimonas sp.]|nr:MAG: hypothetical protein EON88_32320 [Brevundimonas sp.]
MIHRIAGAVLGAVGLWLTLPAPSLAADIACRQQSPEVFVLTGEIDQALADCVAERLQPTTREVILNSRGGSVGPALDIAERFEGKGLTMRVRRECNSSCANYFLPLAGRLIVERGAIIGLHGSIDPMLIADSRDRGDTVAAVNLIQTAQRQMAFARRNDIHPGWLLYRRAGATATEGLDGAWGGQTSASRMFIVEERMARSCLPNVEIVPYQADLEATVLRADRLERLQRRGVARSATVVCNGVGWDDFPPPEAVG